MVVDPELDAAVLRAAFNRAAAEYPSRYQMPKPVQEWWAALYEAIRDTEAGLQLLGKIARLEAEVKRLQAEITALTHRRDHDSL